MPKLRSVSEGASLPDVGIFATAGARETTHEALVLVANLASFTPAGYTNHSKYVIRNSAGKTLENKAGFLDK
ncbi:hypothetical protein [Shewanella sp. KCT]|uniref:hypothetical protein n=1 Tax=Shewanella sp. KCT TaxID=2569535 RepID=UPI001183A909|nr:hypothetical protein [Shewanella sp. KCT]